MRENQNTLNEFRGFAERTLRNHLEELNTRYRDREIDGSTLREAYRQHAKILETELNEKMNEIGSDETIQDNLHQMKMECVDTLRKEGEQQ